MRNFPFYIFCVYLNACASSSAWVVDRRPDSGIIGYKIGNGEDAQKELDQIIKQRAKQICGNRQWQIVRDSLRSQQGAYTYVQPQTTTINSTYNYNSTSFVNGSSYGNNGYTSASAFGHSNGTINGSQSETTYVPVTQSYTEYWREAEVNCGNAQGMVSSNRPMIGIEADLAFMGKGVKVVKVFPNSPAGLCGIQAGDIITEIGYLPIQNFDGLLSSLSKMKGVNETSVTFCRDDKCVSTEVKMGSPAH